MTLQRLLKRKAKRPVKRCPDLHVSASQDVVVDSHGIARKRSNGQWVKGQSGNPAGHSRARRAMQKDYLAVIFRQCTPEAWARVVDRAIRDAMKGDSQARKFLRDYVVGKATQPISLGVSDAVEEKIDSILEEVYA